MELIGVFRILWEKRVFVALGIFGAVAMGLLVGRMVKPTAAVVPGVGVARLVLDTADSQLVEDDPKGADTLPMRASLLADTLASPGGTATVARAAGIDPKDLLILFPAATKDPTDSSPLVDRVSKVTAGAQAPYIVNVLVDDEMPVLSIEAYAPDDAHVRRLTDAAVAGLRSQLAVEDAGGTNGLVLSAVSPPRIERTPVHSHAAIEMLVAAILAFAAWCLSLVVAVALWRRWRRLDQGSGRAMLRRAV